MSYPLDDLAREVAFVSYHLHWGREQVLRLSHRERRRWASEISAIHERENERAP